MWRHFTVLLELLEQTGMGTYKIRRIKNTDINSLKSSMYTSVCDDLSYYPPEEESNDAVKNRGRRAFKHSNYNVLRK